MQVNITFDPASEAEVEGAMKAVMTFMVADKKPATKPAEKAATGPTPEAAAKKAEQEAAAEKKRKAEAAAAKKAEEEKAAAAAAEEEADPLAGDEEPAAEEVTQAQVLEALKNYREIEGTDAVISLLKEHGATHIKDLKPEHYAAVFKAAS